MINKFTITIFLFLLIIGGYLGWYKDLQVNSIFKSEEKFEKIDLANFIQQVSNNYGMDNTLNKFKSYTKNVGTVKSGKYQGYDRILLITKLYREDNLYTDIQYLLYITKDYKNFITDNDPVNNYVKYKISFKNPVKVTIDKLQDNLPETITLSDKYILVKNERRQNDFNYIEKDSLNDYYKDSGIEYRSLNMGGFELLTAKISTTVYVNDEGMFIRYHLAPKFNTGLEVLTSNQEINNLTYGIKLKKPLKPKYTFKNYSIESGGGFTISDYQTVALTDEDMTLITEEYGNEIYEIKNRNNKTYQTYVEEIYKGRASAKTKDFNDREKVEYEKNIKNGAIIFIKNPFGGYIPMFESELTTKILGGGKPVIYLYPEQDTQITVKFELPMIFNNVVPNYITSWEVLASSDGQIINLKPEETECAKIRFTSATSYARNACENNNYPYLYWSGGIYNLQKFLTQKEGFVVAKNDLDEFFDEKLSFIGLNQKEIYDFKEYWLNELNDKNYKYFTISFLQNDELNALVPMRVTPKPESQIRIFMDWYGYNSKPNIKEQVLQKYNRDGFTLVEWGGYSK